jgi:hypothetical protein
MEPSIDRFGLRQQLERVAQRRAMLTLLPLVAGFIVAELISRAAPGAPLLQLAGFAPIIGACVIARKYRQSLPPHAPPCPFCGGSLWKLGTENFKARRMKVRADATGCPHCGARLSDHVTVRRC